MISGATAAASSPSRGWRCTHRGRIRLPSCSVLLELVEIKWIRKSEYLKTKNRVNQNVNNFQYNETLNTSGKRTPVQLFRVGFRFRNYAELGWPGLLSSFKLHNGPIWINNDTIWFLKTAFIKTLEKVVQAVWQQLIIIILCSHERFLHTCYTLNNLVPYYSFTQVKAHT